MKRVIATLGVAGLGLLTVTAPAFAAENISLCHATKSAANPYVLNVINGNGLNGHDEDTDDIIPPNALLAGGMNWTPAGIATYNNNCVPVTVVNQPVVNPPVVEQPVTNPPVVEQPVTNPPVVEQPVVAAPPAVVPPPVVAPPVVGRAAQAPLASSAGVPVSAAPVSQGTNKGFNAQTAAGGNTGSEAPGWLAGLGALLAAGIAVSARRRLRTE